MSDLEWILSSNDLCGESELRTAILGAVSRHEQSLLTSSRLFSMILRNFGRESCLAQRVNCGRLQRPTVEIASVFRY